MELTPDVSIEVGELDLTGVPAARRPVVAASFERELARLVAERAPLPSPGPPGAPREAPPVRARPDGNPVLFGAALARSVYDALGQEGSGRSGPAWPGTGRAGPGWSGTGRSGTGWSG